MTEQQTHKDNKERGVTESRSDMQRKRKDVTINENKNRAQSSAETDEGDVKTEGRIFSFFLVYYILHSGRNSLTQARATVIPSYVPWLMRRESLSTIKNPLCRTAVSLEKLHFLKELIIPTQSGPLCFCT